MGIQGLLSFLDKASRPVNISEFSGCTVAVDSYCWLHKGAFSCAEKLARGEKTDQYVNYCMKFVNMLLSFNIKPILVFDGRHLPAKAETEKKRRELRESNRKKAAEFLRLGRDSEARSLIQRCVDVTHEMALTLIKQCRSQGVDCIVAPYEADAQLAYLNLNGFAHIVITEDSDLMLFGCKLVLFKMDVYGNGVLVEQSKIPLAMKQHPNQFSMDKFRYMCILSGCDYLKSLPGIGLAKACKFIKKTADDNISRALTRLGAYLNMPNLEITQDYRDKFIEADGMFKYQPVFDPVSRSVVPLNPLPEGVTSPLVNLLDKEVCFQLALGNLNPFTLERVDSWDPDQPQSIRTSSWKSNAHKHKSIWARDYKIPPPLPARRDPREVEHKSTKGKTAVQPVSQITDKIAALPHKSSIENEIAMLRESYSVKPPPAKKMCIEDGEEEESEVYSSDSGIATEADDQQNSEENNDIFQGIIKTHPKESSENLEFTLDDILNEQSFQGTEGKSYSRNPFSKVSKKSQEKPERKSLGGALDLFSKLKKTQVEAACVVQSRYFASERPVAPVDSRINSKDENNGEEEADLNETLLEIITATPSPKKRSMLTPRISDLGLSPKKASPRKNIFMVSDVDEDKQNEPVSPKSSLSTTPRKNIFSVSKAPESETSTSPVAPKPQSFLKILDDVSKELKNEENQDRGSKSVKKLGSSSFKWTQPILDCTKKPGAERSLLGLYKPTSKQRASPIIPSKSPQMSSKKKATNSSPKGRPGGLPEKLSFKSPISDSNGGQKSILNMFAFQPKPKLKTTE